jgi:glutamyl-tRNA(Gln) amidotransferase subunit D
LKKITVITTGGTIGSVLGSQSVEVDLDSRRILKELGELEVSLGCKVEVHSPLNKNSEDFTPADWVVLLTEIVRVNKTDCHGIVVTHGTDTMEYSLAAVLAYSHLWSKKICFTGAYYSPDHPKSDALLNLQAAISCVCSEQIENAVYVSFREDLLNTDARIIRGAELKSMQYDELTFDSVYRARVGRFRRGLGIDELHMNGQFLPLPTLDCLTLPDEGATMIAKGRIAMVSLYPGIDKNLLVAASAGREILVLQGYHCGSGPADDSSELLHFLTDNSEGPTILMGSYPERYIDRPYRSTFVLKENGVHIYKDLQTHFLYVFSLLGLALGLEPKNIVNLISAFEIQLVGESSKWLSDTGNDFQMS